MHILDADGTKDPPNLGYKAQYSVNNYQESFGISGLYSFTFISIIEAQAQDTETRHVYSHVIRSI